ncbi:AlpA family phage regulatory protein [Variovorax guangxiensis]|uniref:helix-turn-helix transcriptional regulator n=1 Tax=Variovorax guangxiensis TaxID=1775474 RepID=UPI002856A112|nr:AlpA family phage regulatory protein [Variovorax guangxiensis]MDR6855316.1 putative DNA-binding transcriptional regulator AlpA [Variovorax guangxiensis]
MPDSPNSSLQAELAAAVACDGALVRKPIVSLLVGVRDRHLDTLVKRDQFPRPIKLGPHCVRWRSGDVKKWLAEQKPAAAA